MLETQRGNVSVEDYPVHVASGEVCVTHRGDMSEKGIQFLVGVEDAVLSKIIGGRSPAFRGSRGRGFKSRRPDQRSCS